MIDQQRHTEQMLSLFHAVFGPRGPGGQGGQPGASGVPGAGGLPGGFPGVGDVLGGMGFGSGDRPSQRREREEDRSAFAGMYS